MARDFSSLFARKKFDCAQDDMLVVYSMVYVCLREAKQTPLRFVANSLRENCASPTMDSIMFRRGDHWSPAFTNDNRSFFRDVEGAIPYRKIIIFIVGATIGRP